MSLFKPDFFFDKAWEITPEFFVNNGISCILLDIDNTLTTHGNPNPDEKVAVWLESIEKKVKAVIISNNTYERVAPFAEKIGVDCICHAQKPLSGGVNEASVTTGIAKKNMLIIGDQIFTDVLCGKFSGVRTALVEPIELETMPFFKIKRFFEKLILGRARKTK